MFDDDKLHKQLDTFFNRVLFIDNPIVAKSRIVLRAECGEIKSKSPTLSRWITKHLAELL